MVRCTVSRNIDVLHLLHRLRFRRWSVAFVLGLRPVRDPLGDKGTPRQATEARW